MVYSVHSVCVRFKRSINCGCAKQNSPNNNNKITGFRQISVIFRFYLFIPEMRAREKRQKRVMNSQSVQLTARPSHADNENYKLAAMCYHFNHTRHRDTVFLSFFFFHIFHACTDYYYSLNNNLMRVHIQILSRQKRENAMCACIVYVLSRNISL